MNPLLSIITVCYNAADVIKPTLDSVASQDWQEFEYIIIDGKSTDGTVDIVKSCTFPNIRILSERDHGIYDAMNKGLEMATGHFVLFLNAGDSFFDHRVLSRFAEAATNNPDAGVIYGQTVIVDKYRHIIGPRHLTAPVIATFKSFSRGMLICHQAFFARKDLAPWYDTRYRFSADFDWCIAILKQSRLNIYLGEEPVVCYLEEGATTRNRFKSLRERFIIMTRNYGLVTTTANHLGFVFRAIKRRIK